MTKPIFFIILAELFGTSLWFSANSISGNLINEWGLVQADIGFLTNSVQSGFIVGTLIISFSGWADRYPASRIFTLCCCIGSLFNAFFALLSVGLISAAAFRFVVGLSLAGIYPLGMKLIVGWDPKNAGKSLGLLVGMLTLGTALPHGIRVIGGAYQWQWIILASSFLVLIGAVIVYFLGDGPHLKLNQGKAKQSFGNVYRAFKVPEFRASALGYFGHMWELYSFWTLVPLLLASIWTIDTVSASTLSTWSFAIIAIGALGCIYGGVLSHKIGSAKVAWYALICSGLMCLIYPFTDALSPIIRLGLLLVWGISVVADSPQFSAMSAKACPQELVGTALAIQNSLGFLLTIFSIAIVTAQFGDIGSKVAWILLPGPIIGLFFMRPLLKETI